MSMLSQTINKIVTLVVILAWLAGMTACSDSLSERSKPSGLTVKGDSITLNGNLNIPLMVEARSRALGEAPNDDLKLTLFEFDYAEGNASASFLTNVYKAELFPNEDGSTSNMKFKVTLKSASTPKVLHLMVANKEFSSNGYGSEASIVPSLSVGASADGGLSLGGDPDAYWGHVVFKDGYNSLDQYGEPVVNDELKTKLTNVPLIRNFAKVSVTSEVDNAVFDFRGFVLMNVPTSGTVAPWIRSSLSTPDLLDGNAMKKFEDITYRGILPAEVKFRNTGANSGGIILGSTEPQYMYEHPYESTRRTYIIIMGRYFDSTGAGTTGFYKIDIGKQREDGSFNYYNIIRNIHYNITIKSVNAPGKRTIQEAIDAVPFNNISAETETSSMLSISDGKNLLITNTLNHVIVDNSEPIEFMYRYIRDVDQGSGKYPDNDYKGLDVIGLVPGDVIRSVAQPEKYTDDSGAEWVLYKIYPRTPTPDVKTQEFTVVDGNGLGRTIHLIMRSPWQYAPVYKGEDGKNYYATVANGSDNMYDTANPQPETISSESGQPLTVYFNLPDGLPEAMFPLEFTLESKHQWIENNKIGTLVVTSDKSLFEENNIAIQYLKKVSYQEYCYQVNDDNIPDINDPNTTHTIRCRFLTIAEGTADNAEIRIHNPYFIPDATVEFKRKVSSDIML